MAWCGCGGVWRCATLASLGRARSYGLDGAFASLGAFHCKKLRSLGGRLPGGCRSVAGGVWCRLECGGMGAKMAKATKAAAKGRSQQVAIRKILVMDALSSWV